MADISINLSSFPQEGGTFTISLTKTSGGGWGVITIPTAAWYSVGRMDNISPYLYEIDVDVAENDSGSSRMMTIFVTPPEEETDIFNITQPAAAQVSANIVSYTAGNIAASGGQITVDVQSVNGDDGLSTASSNQSWCVLSSTTHGVTSGGVLCTRFVFTVSQNTGNSSRSVTLTFTVSDGGNTDSATLSKSQDGAPLSQGSLAVANASVTATATSANAVITAVDMVTSSIVVMTSPFVFVSSASVQVVGGNLVLALTFPANTGAARSETIALRGTDNWGNTLTASMTLSQGAAGATREITASWDNGGYLGYEGGSETATISYTGTFSGNASVTTGTLPDGVSIGLNSNTELEVTYSGGNIAETIYIPITISRTGSDSVVYSVDLVFVLAASGVFPIWKDVFGVIVSDEDFEDYELKEGASLMYAGRAFAYPDEDAIRVNLSRVVAPYLIGYYKDVDFYAQNTLLGSYTFVRDYSYDATMDYTQNLWLNRPINGRVPSGVKLSVAMWAAASGGSMQVSDTGGSLVVNKTLAKGLNLGEWISGSPGQKYTFGSEFYEVVDACEAVLLKYVNAYGGIDFLLVEGVSKKSDKITRASYEKDAAAGTTDFETTDYQASMEANWQGTTGWLTDAQSLRMKHLVESVEVYMINQNGEEIRVVMRDGELQHKTFRSNGAQLVNYTLKWAESQKKIRR